MLLKDVEGKNRTILVTVAGIFTNTDYSGQLAHALKRVQRMGSAV